MRRALAALLLLLACSAAAAAEPWERFFELSLGDLRAEAAEARKSGQVALLVMFQFEECPYCAKMKREVLSRQDVQDWFRTHFRAIEIDTRGAQSVTLFDGRTIPEKDFALTVRVRGTPTFVFYAPGGEVLAMHIGAIYDPKQFMLLGEYVASGAYREGSFATYRQSRLKRGS